MLTYVTFPIAKKYEPLNFSPFCAKAEFFLILNKIAHEKQYLGNTSKAPRGKLPFIKFKGQSIPDSEQIIATLSKEYSIDMDAHLSEEQRSSSYITRKMMEDHLYWVMLYFRWVNEENWKTTKNVFFDGMPAPLKAIIPALVRKSVVNACHSQGISRYEESEIMEMAQKGLHSLSIMLGEKKFFFGDQISHLDVAAYGMFSNMLYDFVPESDLKRIISSYGNLVQYTEYLHHEIAKKQ